MADVSKEPRHYPDILKLGLMESAINFFINDYKQVQKQYIQNVKAGFSKKAKANLKTMDALNNILLTDLGKAQDVMGEIYPKGIDNQHQIQKENPKLRRMASELNEDKAYLNSIQQQGDDIEGEYQTTKLESRSLYVKYIIMIILMIIVAALTFRAFMVPNSNAIESIILVAALALIIYFIYEKLF